MKDTEGHIISKCNSWSIIEIQEANSRIKKCVFSADILENAKGIPWQSGKI